MTRIYWIGANPVTTGFGLTGWNFPCAWPTKPPPEEPQIYKGEPLTSFGPSIFGATEVPIPCVSLDVMRCWYFPPLLPDAAVLLFVYFFLFVCFFLFVSFFLAVAKAPPRTTKTLQDLLPKIAYQKAIPGASGTQGRRLSWYTHFAYRSSSIHYSQKGNFIPYPQYPPSRTNP